MAKYILFLKIYIKQSPIWVSLPTCKMELFVRISVYKVIFCRLMLWYTQYALWVSLFVSTRYWFHSVPGGFTGKHRRCCFLSRTIANVVFYWAMILHVQFFSYEFLVFFLCRFVAESFSFQMILGSSSSFQVVLGCYRWSQVRSSSFLILVCTEFSNLFL